MAEMSRAVHKAMRGASPELDESIDRVSKIILGEEIRFAHTLAIGLKRLEEDLEPFLASNQRAKKFESDLPRVTGAGGKGKQALEEARNKAERESTYPGDKAFKLYDTYGLPLDFIVEALRDQGLPFDEAGFELAMEEQRTRARASWKGGHKDVANPVYAKLAEKYRTEPDFYFGTTAKNRRIEAIVTKDGAVNELPPGAEGEIVLDRTVFYAESGGQVSDIGTLWNNEHTMQLAEVRGAYYPVSGLIAHRIVAKEKLGVGDLVAGDADGARREHIKRNHTATHLMHAALRNILGTHVKQAGSLVDPGRLRFDFSHFAAIDAAELRDIEQQVNDEILLNSEIGTDVTTIDDALASGALAFFGDRYPEQNVRVVTIPDASAPRGFYSKELCGGTHVRRTGDIGAASRRSRAPPRSPITSARDSSWEKSPRAWA
jgi:alanyl-tRNA synthetase